MVNTRRGTSYRPTKLSYGRAARGKKVKLALTGPRRTTRAAIVAAERAHQEKEDHHVPDVMAPAASALTRRKTRSLGGPVCSDYGPYRHELYKGHGFFFCQNCTWWDNDNILNKRIKRTSNRYRCRAHHSSFVHPTHLGGNDEYLPSKSRQPYSITNKMNDDENDDDENIVIEPPRISLWSLRFLHSNASVPRSEQEDLQGRNTKLEEELQILREHNEMLKSSLAKETEMVATLRGTIEEDARAAAQQMNKFKVPEELDLKRLFMFKINSELEERNKHNGKGGRPLSSKTIGKALGEAVWDEECAGGCARSYLLSKCKKFLRDTIFNPWMILKAMDLAGGQLSFTGYNVLRSIETGGKKGVRGCLLPSVAELQRVGAIVETYAQQKLGQITMITTPHGEGFKFDYEKILKNVFEAFSLDKAAGERRVLVAESIDAAQLHKHITFVAGGFKINDKAALCPFTKHPLIAIPDASNAQSRNLCFPLKVIIGKETKETFRYFSDMFGFFDACSNEATNPLTGYKPINAVINCDLSATWKGLCKGGAMKRQNLPCHCCPITSDEAAMPNPAMCERWCKEVHSSRVGWSCYHHSMTSDESLDDMKQLIEVLQSTFERDLSDINAASKMTTTDVDKPRGNSTSDCRSIHFAPASLDEKEAFAVLVTEELVLRGLAPLGSFVQRRAALQNALQAEQSIRKLKLKLEHSKSREGALFLLIMAIPCSLHMHNRCALKVLTMLLIEGLSNAKKGLSYGEHRAVGTRIEKYIEDVENAVNCNILGDVNNPAQWECSRSPDRKEIGVICLDNMKCIRIMRSLDQLIDLSIMVELRIQKWKNSVQHFQEAFSMLRRKEDFDLHDIVAFQTEADLFFQDWVALHGAEGCTNYIHMMASGHIADYLFRWKNLYVHSQQGWEAMNALVKNFFFRRTGRGGARHGAKSRLKPIARWFHRRIMWLLGIDQHAAEEATFHCNNTNVDNDATDDNVHGDG